MSDFLFRGLKADYSPQVTHSTWLLEEQMAAAYRAHALAEANSIDASARDDSKLRELGDILRSTAESGGFFTFSYSLTKNALISWSDNASTILGTEERDMALDGNVFLRHVHTDDRFFVLNALEASMSAKVPFRTVYRWIRPDNNAVRWLNCRGAVLEADDILGGIIVDVTEELSRTSGEWEVTNTAAVIESLSCAIVVLDPEFRILRKTGEELLRKLDEGEPRVSFSKLAIGFPFIEAVETSAVRDSWQRMLREILTGERKQLTLRVPAGESTLHFEFRPLREREAVEGIVFTVNDITAFAEAERRLASLQRGEGLRRVAAGAAHHFNNALQSILGHAATILSQPTEANLVKSASESIIALSERAAHLTHEMLLLDETRGKSVTAVDVNLVVMCALNRIEGLFSSAFKVTVNFGSPPSVFAPQSALLSVVESIIRAATAIFPEVASIDPESSELRVQTFSDSSLKEPLARIVIACTSEAGLQTDILRTPSVEGAIQRGVQAVSGHFAIETSGSRNRNETSAQLILNLKGLPFQSTEKRGAGVASEKNKILLIDDDVMVLQTVCAVLGGAGYECMGASDAAEALEIASSNVNQISLIMVDAVMPGMSTSSLVRKLKKLNGDFTIVGFSGAAPEHTTPLLEAGACQIIHKPIDPRALKLKIEELLRGITPQDVATSTT